MPSISLSDIPIVSRQFAVDASSRPETRVARNFDVQEMASGYASPRILIAKRRRVDCRRAGSSRSHTRATRPRDSMGALANPGLELGVRDSLDASRIEETA